MTTVWLLLAFSISLPVLITIFLQGVLTPIRIRRNQTMAADITYVETQAEILTPEFQDFIGRAVRQFNDHGFVVAANVHRAGVTAGLSVVQILLVNRSTNDVAIIAIIFATVTRSMLFGIRSCFADGKRIVTANIRKIGILPPDPKSESMNFSWVREAATLCEVHRRRLEAAGRADEERVSFVAGTEIAYLQSEHEYEMQRFVATGYKRLDRRSNIYKFTWKGAYLSTWKLMQPIQRWRISHRDRRAWQVWKELGMDRWQHVKDNEMRAESDTFDAATSSVPDVGRPIEAANCASAESPLNYQIAFEAGEFRQDFVDGTLRVHFRNPSVGQVLIRQWGNLLWMVCLVILFGWSLLQTWISWRFYSSIILPAGFHRPRLLTPSLLVWPILLGLQAWQLVRGLSRANGISIVEANSGGLSFSNAPGSTQAGRIARENLDRLLIRIDTPGMFRRLYRLEARTFSSPKAMSLFVGPSKVAMERVRKSLAQAMGMEAH